MLGVLAIIATGEEYPEPPYPEAVHYQNRGAKQAHSEPFAGLEQLDFSRLGALAAMMSTTRLLGSISSVVLVQHMLELKTYVLHAASGSRAEPSSSS